MTSTQCPKCGFERLADAVDCPACGIIFSKYQELQDLPPVPPALQRELSREAVQEDVQPGRFNKQVLTSLGVGLAAALVAHFTCVGSFFTYMIVLFHEFGHALWAWVLGRPAIPAFDFMYGGGITHWRDQQLPLIIFWFLALGFFIWFYRRNKLTVSIFSCLALAYGLLVFSKWEEVYISFMGHGTEVILMGFFYYMALTGFVPHWPGAHRAQDYEKFKGLNMPAAAFIAFFTQFKTASFALKLMNDKIFLRDYMVGKGGALMNDFDNVQQLIYNWTGLNLKVPGVAKIFLVFSLLAPLVALLWFVFRPACHKMLVRIFTVDP